jgi:Flp pilus assembly protein TadD
MIGNARKNGAALTVIGILLLGSLAYAPSLGYPYLQDAVHAVWTNPVVERGDVVEIFTSDYWKATRSDRHTLYRPVTVLSFAFERILHDEASSWLSRLLGLLLHQLTAVMLFVYVRRLGAPTSVAAAVALSFTVHPLMLQAVVNVVGRADVLATGFTVLALWAMSHSGVWRGGPVPSAGRQRLAAWSAALALFLALGSKEIAIAAALLVLIQQALFRPPRGADGWIRSAAALAPCGLAIVTWAVLRTNAIGEFPGLQAIAPEDNVIVLLGLEGVERAGTALAMAARYLGLFVLPLALSADYSGTAIAAQDGLFTPAALTGLVFLLAMTAVGFGPWIQRGRNDAARVGAIGAWLFLLPYLVVGNLVVLSAAGFAERLVYMPAAGFLLVAVVALDAAARRLRVPPSVAAAALCVLLVAAVVQVRSEARMWRSARDLYERSLAAEPRSLRFNMALAHLYRGEDRPQEALRHFELNVEHAPMDPGSWTDLGIFLVGRGEFDRAEPVLREAIRLDARRGAAHAYLGALLRRTGRPAEAERSLRRALLFQPGLLLSAEELGHLFFDSGRYAEAANLYRGCVRLGRTGLRERLARAEALAAGR